MAIGVLMGTVPVTSSSTQHVQTIVFEHYFTSDNGTIGMGGFTFDTFLNDSLFYRLSVLEAVGGVNRAGYAVAGFGVGWLTPVAPRWNWTGALEVGAGGGGHLTEGTGGGLSFKYQTGLHYSINPEWGWAVSMGWLDFPDGTLHTPIVSTGLTWRHWDYRNTDTDAVPKEAIKSVQVLTLDHKSFIYNQDSGETISLIGGRFRKFITPTIYWGEAGYAAISGKRHGYIEGALIGGIRSIFMDRLVWDLGVGIGAGGGGGDSREGDGLMVQTYAELGYSLTDRWALSYQVGTMSFVNGDINSTVSGLNLGYTLWSVQGAAK
ncbi:hypothetical protein HOH87_07635 [bacterium]|jgi:hypothetical protein|nr:hypothetical protein [bacterium]